MLSLIPRLPVGHIRSRSLAKAKTTPGAGGYALLFPSNVTGSSNSSAYGVIEFADPDDNGLPILGPSNAGVTVIRRIKTIQQNGYYAQFWYTPILTGPIRAPISGEAYWGFHPYPDGADPKTSNTSHDWQIGCEGDILDTLAGFGTRADVTKGEWQTQALRVEYNGNDPILTFWVDLPSTANADKIQYSASSGIGTTSHTYKIVIGNSPWYTAYSEERASCHHGQIKIFATALSESDIVSEGNSMTTLATSAGQSAIWWGKKGFASIDDLTCDYATGRSFTRNDSSNILTLGDAL